MWGFEMIADTIREADDIAVALKSYDSEGTMHNGKIADLIKLLMRKVSAEILSVEYTVECSCTPNIWIPERDAGKSFKTFEEAESYAKERLRYNGRYGSKAWKYRVSCREIVKPKYVEIKRIVEL